jgi:hypothetical protein
MTSPSCELPTNLPTYRIYTYAYAYAYRPTDRPTELDCTRLRWGGDDQHQDASGHWTFRARCGEEGGLHVRFFSLCCVHSEPQLP